MPPMTRRRLIQGSSLLAVSALLSACGKGEEEKIKPEEFWKTPGSPTKEYYGFIDESGSWAIPPQFSNPSYFSEDGVAPVLLRRYIEEQSKACVYSGIIGASGEWVKEPEYGLEMGCSFSEGLIDTIVRERPGYKSKDDMGGYMDTSGEWVIEPTIQVGEEGWLGYFHEADSFIGESHTAVGVLAGKETKEYRCGVIDQKGGFIIEERFGHILLGSGPLASAEDISDGDESLYGFIDNTGSWVIPPTFKFANAFMGEYARVVDAETGLEGLITQDGQWAVPPKYRDLDLIDATRAFARDPQSKLVGVLDLSQDSWILGSRWYRAWTESSNTYVMAMTEKGGPVGIYAMDTGETVLEPAYKSLSYASSYLIAAQELEGGLWGYIDIGGTWVIKPSFKDAYSFRNGLACAISSE